MSDQSNVDASPDPRDDADPSAMAARFQELAGLGAALIAAENKIAALSDENLALTRTVVRLRKENAGAHSDTARQAADTRVATLSRDVERLAQAVADKERTRFALQEEVWALTEALTECEQLNPEVVSDLAATRMQDIVRLSQMVRDGQERLAEAEDRTAELELELAREHHATEKVRQQSRRHDEIARRTDPGGAPADATADDGRDQVMTAADFPHLAGPSRGYVFIVSFGLSGDVALQGLINRLDGVCVRGENGGLAAQLANVWHLADEAAEPGTESFDHLNRLGWHLADSFVETVLTPPDGVRFAGFRDIRWSESASEFDRQLDFLYSYFPNARFVLHSRNPADVAKLGWWAEQLSETVIKSLTHRCDLMESYHARYPGRSILLDYDDYVAAPDQLTPLFDLLETPYDQSLVTDWLQEIAND